MKDGLRRRVVVLHCLGNAVGGKSADDFYSKIFDHLQTRCDVVRLNASDGVPAWLRLVQPDVLILHPSYLDMRIHPLYRLWKHETESVRHVDCPKIAMPRDEFDHHEILDEWLFELGVKTIFTALQDSLHSLVYPIMSQRVIFRRCLMKYFEESTADACQHQMRPIRERPLDLIYRAQPAPFWRGSYGQLKDRLVTTVAAQAKIHGLNSDLAVTELDEAKGEWWLKFLASSKTVLSCEYGSSALDRRGEIRSSIELLRRENPDGTFENISARMPSEWDAYSFYSFGPQQVDAIMTKTCQILLEGDYDGVLEPGKHYIPLRRDLSNLDDVLHRIKDDAYIEHVAERAYADMSASSHTSHALAERLFGAVEEISQGTSDQRQEQTTVARIMWATRGLAIKHSQRNLRARAELQHFFRWWLSDGSVSLLVSFAVKSVFVLSLIARTPKLRHLLVGFIRLNPGGLIASLRQALPDLMRLYIIAKAQAGRFNRRNHLFHTHMKLDRNTGTLTLLSFPDESCPYRQNCIKLALDAQEWDHVEKTIRDGLVQSILWDHGAVGPFIKYQVTKADWTTLNFGNEGIHEFRCFNRLIKDLPEDMCKALQRALRGELCHTV